MATKRQDSYAESKTLVVLSSLGQRLVTLLDANRAELLSEATQLTHSDESRAQAAAILSRLKELNPEVASQFHPKEDALTSLCLRMITPSTSPQQSPDSHPHVPSYIAVSYCWHYPQWVLPAAATPLAPGWEISQPMMDAVMALRQRPDEGVWLDKLCINQGDESDKMTHIGAMDDIYRAARRTVILLEDVQFDAAEEGAGLAYAGFYEDLCREVNEGGLEGQEKVRFINEYFPRREEEYRANAKGGVLAAGKPFAMKLLSARWFSRAWCAHESRMTRHRKVDNPLFLCFGSDGKVLSFEFRFVHYLSRYLVDKEPPSTLIGREFLTAINDPNPKTLHQYGWRIQRLMPDSIEGSAMQHLISVLSFGCFKKGDLMSIALNTAGIPLYFGGRDIQCVEDVMWMYSLLVLASGDLSPLVASGARLRIPGSGGDIISWAINPNQGSVEDRVLNPLPGSITAITRQYIELDLLVFEAAPKQPSADAQARATRLITDHGLYDLAQDVLSTLSPTTQSTIRDVTSSMTRVNPTSRPLEALPRNFLSLALDNGLAWILAFPSALQTATDSTAWFHGPIPSLANPALLPAVHDLLSHLNHSSPDPDQTLLEQTTLSLTALLDPRLLLFPSNHRTILFDTTNALLTPPPSNRSYIALAAVLSHLPACYDRAWVVEPFDITAPPEKMEDWLPPANMRIAKEGDKEEKIEDVLPVLTSDFEDRREPIGLDGGRGTWRVRKRQRLFGGVEDWGAVLNGEVKGDMEGVVLLRKQRVYGAEDYPWAEIRKEMRRAMGDTAVN